MTDSNILRNYNFFLNSSQRDLNTSIVSPTWTLNQKLFLNGLVPSNFVFFLNRMQIAFTWNQFSSNAKNIQCEYSIQFGSNPLQFSSFSIQPGNYDILQLTDAFLTSLRISIIQLTTVALTFTYTYTTFDNAINFVFEDTTGVHTIITILTNNFSGLARAMGFSGNFILDNTIKQTTSNVDVNVSQSKVLYLTSETLNTNYTFVALDESKGLVQETILASFPIERNPLIYLSFSPARPIISVLSNNVIDQIQFTLRDDLAPELNAFLIDWDIDFTIQEIVTESQLVSLSRVNERMISEQANNLSPVINVPVSQMSDEQLTTKAIEEYKNEQKKELEILKKTQLDKLLALKEKVKTLKNQNQ